MSIDDRAVSAVFEDRDLELATALLPQMINKELAKRVEIEMFSYRLWIGEVSEASVIYASPEIQPILKDVCERFKMFAGIEARREGVLV